MFATNESASSVAGTIQDQALMNAVAGKLRAWNVSVIIPEIYNPYGMAGVDSRNSVYFSNLENLMQARRSCVAFKTSNLNTPPDQLSQIDALVAGIDAFQKLVIPPELAQNPAPKNPPATSSPAVAQASGSGTPPQVQISINTGSSTQSAVSTVSHFQAILQIDGLARALGFEGDGSKGPSTTWQHVLWMKALESGGTVSKEGNIFGTKLRFSGGAVATYALFSIDGKLDCSGNVYNFQKAVRSKEVAQAIAVPTSVVSGTHSTCSQQ
jgi:hypothetical protein